MSNYDKEGQTETDDTVRIGEILYEGFESVEGDELEGILEDLIY